MTKYLGWEWYFDRILTELETEPYVIAQPIPQGEITVYLSKKSAEKLSVETFGWLQPVMEKLAAMGYPGGLSHRPPESEDAKGLKHGLLFTHRIVIAGRYIPSPEDVQNLLNKLLTKY